MSDAVLIEGCAIATVDGAGTEHDRGWILTEGDRISALGTGAPPPAGGARRIDGRDLLAQTLSPPAFPISPEGLRGRWQFCAWDGGARVLEGFTVRAVDVAHKGGRTFAHRVERDGERWSSREHIEVPALARQA